MFGHDNQDNNTNAPVTRPAGDQDSAGSSLPFDPSTISLSSDAADTSTAPAPQPSSAHAPGPAHDEPVSTPAPSTTTPVDPLLETGKDNLLAIKQTALQQLSPLVGHLDQTPEEKFQTTMMMIRASDDQSLVQTAYEAAKAITDDKARAQALLDIINEINYFTQQQQQQD